MEQIYYTQCPVGYGLGVSNGFQIKRRTEGYPLSGDFRHLGLKAFPAGGRTLAPPSLRYRRVVDRAEVAWLTPRPMEYETERGLWGRPGGHFAHGVILDTADVNALDGWLAGLYDRPFWRRSDPEPSRGRPPESAEISPDDLLTQLDFAAVARLGEGLSHDLVARLLTALATVAREGRTLFLIDEPDRLGPRIALLTFLIPPPFRASLTFSTYHDRPEELPGYRIHGATPAVRPNRPLWLTQGIVADLTNGSVEPHVEPASWSREVARWVEGGMASEWDDFARRWAQAEGSPGYVAWDQTWLDRLVDFGRAIRRTPSDPAWADEARLAAWAAASRLSGEWAAARGPDWWREAEVGAGEGRRALLTLASWPAIWGSSREAAWGEVVARWFGGTPELEAAAVVFAKGAASNAVRFGFVQALRKALPEDSWSTVRGRLDDVFRSNPKMVALWSVPEAVAAAVAGRLEPLRELIARFEGLGEPVETLLEAARVEAEERPKRVERVGEALIDAFDRPPALRWALGQGDLAVYWLRAYLRRRLAMPDDREGLKSLLDETPDELRHALASVVLAVAADRGLPDDGFRWGVEEVLMAILETERPTNPAWPGHYLDRSASDLALIQMLFTRSTRSTAVRAWFEAAKGRGELGPQHLERLAHLKTLARSLDVRSAGGLDAVDLTRVPGCDRGEILARLLRRDANAGADSGPLLERCGSAWVESLLPDSPDLPKIARVVAESDLLAEVGDVETWFHRLDLVRDRLAADRGLGPDGLVGRVIACRARRSVPDRATWALRDYLVNGESTWRTIAEDFRLDLNGVEPDSSPAVVEAWDREISKRRPERFWQVVLNVCDGRRLAAVVAARAGDLATLGRLAWWDHPRHPEALDDLRDGYARLVPLAPIAEEALNGVQNWMEGRRAGEPPARSRPWLSPHGLARWSCLDRLSKDIFREGITDQTRRFSILNWANVLPLASIPPEDRYRLVAWVLFKLEDPSALDVARVGLWLVRSGVTDPARLADWPSSLAGIADVPQRIVRDRKDLVDALRREIAQVVKDRVG
jgi:hypothetical protein